MSESEGDDQWKIDERDTIERVHAALSKAAETQNVKKSTLHDSTSVHEFSAESASFGNLKALWSVACAHNAELRVETFVGNRGNDLIFSARLGTDTASPAPSDAPPAKRARTSGGDQDAERLEELRASLLKRCPTAEVSAAIDCMSRLVKLRVDEEAVRVVVSYTLLLRKLSSVDTRPRLVIAVRLVSGFAIPLGPLKRALGSLWVDGLLSTDETAGGLKVGDLSAPASPCGTLVMVTSVPHAEPV